MKSLVFLISIFFSAGSIAQGNKEIMSQQPSATEWKQMYFYAITKKAPSEINLPQNLVASLLGMVGVKSAISTGEAIDPRYIINEKGTTTWLAMYALIATQNPEALTALKENGGLLHVPSPFLNSSFKTHINWPETIISKYNLKLENYNLITIPFLIPEGSGSLTKLSQSMKAPDGSMEIFGFEEFRENKPEHLLGVFNYIINFINENRPDVTKS